MTSCATPAPKVVNRCGIFANVLGNNRTLLTWSEPPLVDGVSVVVAAIPDAKPRDTTGIRAFGAEVERAYTGPRVAPFDCDW